jgi:hypothetical protein
VPSDGTWIRNLLYYPSGEATRWIERANERLVLGIGTTYPGSGPVYPIVRFTPGLGPGWGADRGRAVNVPGVTSGITATLQQPDGRVLALGRPTAISLSVTRLQGGPYDCTGDYDGDGSVLATVDSLIGTRIALGINGAAVIGGINFPPGATRTTWPAIRDYLIQNCGLGALQ